MAPRAPAGQAVEQIQAHLERELALLELDYQQTLQAEAVMAPANGHTVRVPSTRPAHAAPDALFASRIAPRVRGLCPHRFRLRRSAPPLPSYWRACVRVTHGAAVSVAQHADTAPAGSDGAGADDSDGDSDGGAVRERARESPRARVLRSSCPAFDPSLPAGACGLQPARQRRRCI